MPLGVPRDGDSLLRFKSHLTASEKIQHTTPHNEYHHTTPTTFDTTHPTTRRNALAALAIALPIALACIELAAPPLLTNATSIVRSCRMPLLASTPPCVAARAHLAPWGGTLWVGGSPAALSLRPYRSWFHVVMRVRRRTLVVNQPASGSSHEFVDLVLLGADARLVHRRLPASMCAADSLDCAPVMLVARSPATAVGRDYRAELRLPRLWPVRGRAALISSVELTWVFDTDASLRFCLLVRGLLLAVALAIAVLYAFRLRAQRAPISLEQGCAAAATVGAIASADPVAPLLSVAPSHALALASAVSQRAGVALLLYCWLHLLETITSEPPHTRSEYQPATVRHLAALKSLPKLVLAAAITFVWRGANLLPIAGQSMTNVAHMSGGDARAVAPLSGPQLAGGWRPAGAAPEDTHARNMQLVSASLWALFTVWLGFLSVRLLNRRRSISPRAELAGLLTVAFSSIAAGGAALSHLLLNAREATTILDVALLHTCYGMALTALYTPARDSKGAVPLRESSLRIATLRECHDGALLSSSPPPQILEEAMPNSNSEPYFRP